MVDYLRLDLSRRPCSQGVRYKRLLWNRITFFVLLHWFVFSSLKTSVLLVLERARLAVNIIRQARFSKYRLHCSERPS